MAKHYTQNFLLRYLYNETSLTQTLEIENAISEDECIQTQFNGILSRQYKSSLYLCFRQLFFLRRLYNHYTIIVECYTEEKGCRIIVDLFTFRNGL